MNEVSAIGAGSTAKSAKELQQLGQDQFMKLMLTQLKNQDPLKPLESTEFLSQLAQFSTVTGIQDVKGAVTDMVGSLRASQALQGAGLIGRIAAAFTATLYGIGAANLVFLPLAGKFELLIAQRLRQHRALTDGLVALAAGESAQSIGWRMQSDPT